MSVELKPNAVNPLPKGTVIFGAGDEVTQVCMMLKGRVSAVGNGVRVTLGAGNFLGIVGLFASCYLFTYTVIEDASVYVLPVREEGTEGATLIMNLNKDYRGIMLSSFFRHTVDFLRARERLSLGAIKLHSGLSRLGCAFLDLAGKTGKPAKITGIDSLAPIKRPAFADAKTVAYLVECTKVPADTQKAFFAPLTETAPFIASKAANEIMNLSRECGAYAEYIHDNIYYLINDTDDNLFFKCVSLANDIRKGGGDAADLIGLADEIYALIGEFEKLFAEDICSALPASHDKAETFYKTLKSGGDIADLTGENEAADKRESVARRQAAMCKNSLDRIIAFGSPPDEVAASVRASVEKLVACANRSATDDVTRRIKKETAQGFYELYYYVYMGTKKTHEVPKDIDLFLTYGFLDERLLPQETLVQLCLLSNDVPTTEGLFGVYTIKEWLDAIYSGDKDPSKNEFDEDYATILRNQKRTNEITEEQEKQFFANKAKRVKFEIDNMFFSNNKLTNGQLATFSPVLYDDMFISGMERSYITRKKLDDTVRELLQIDFSLFHREIMISDPEHFIQREYILTPVYPDVILMPTVGVQGSMWQEVSGKRKDTPARFMLPIFSETNIKDILIKLFGRFRWEIIRNIQGMQWNNIQEKSLTSEYVDYVQFYKKISGLSEDKKEKIKSQIQRAKNNTREIFVMDYEDWVKDEYLGRARLNEIVREILATYCPFPAPVRERLVKMPTYEEAMKRYRRDKAKKLRDLDIRYRAIEKAGGHITPELADTLEFYKTR